MKIRSAKEQIEEYRNDYSSLSRVDLIAEMEQYEPYSYQRIAAKQLLDEMDRTDSSNQHKEILKISKLANRWAFWAFIIGLLSFLAAVSFWTYGYFRPSIDTRQKTETKTIKSELPPSAKDISPPSKPDNHQSKSLSKPEHKDYGK